MPLGAPGSPPPGLLRPKGHLAPSDRWILGLLALAPLVSVAIRVLALPGMVGPELGILRDIGHALDDILSLGAIPPDQREHVLYLLFLPTCALLVALARLTFGIQVLGFRSILISVGFRQSGIVPSLLLITVSVATIVLVRPWLRRIRLPYYGRVSVILCIVALTMVGPLIAGPWVLPGVLWGAAYFPVIVLGMLAEGVAHTLDRDNVVTASWRAITTIVLAFVCALVCWVPALQGLMLQYPELVLTQIAGIVLTSEYLDLRLFQDWDKQVARRILSRTRERDGGSRVAVVRNRLHPIDPGTAGLPARRQALRSVQKVVDALRAGGHTVKVLEGDASLLKGLDRFLSPDATGGEKRGMVLNLAHGVHGDAPATQVPALLEMSGIPYVGPTPLGHAMASDRVVAKTLLQRAAIPTPAFLVMTRAGEAPGRLRYPLVVRPRLEPGAKGKTVADRRELGRAIRRVLRRHGQEALVEERIAGRRISVALIGNDPLECLPLVELDRRRREKICPAAIVDRLAQRVRERARAAFRACGCRDYARVDLCVSDDGEVWVLEVKTLGILACRGMFARAGLTAGYPFDRLVCRIIEVAESRTDARGILPVAPPSSAPVRARAWGRRTRSRHGGAGLAPRPDPEPQPTTSAVS